MIPVFGTRNRCYRQCNRREKTPDLHAMPRLIPRSPRIFSVCFILAYLHLLGVKIHNKGGKKKNNNNQIKCKLWELLFGFSKMVHMSASLRNGGGGCFYICHSSINTHSSLVFSLPISFVPSLLPAPSLVFTLPLLKCEMRGGSHDNWPCVSWGV